jgi:hypothetical protein
LSRQSTQLDEIKLFDQELVEYVAILHVSVIAPKLHLDMIVAGPFTDTAFQGFRRKDADQFVKLRICGQPKKMQRTEVNPSQAANDEEEKPDPRTSSVNTESTNMCRKESLREMHRMGFRAATRRKSTSKMSCYRKRRRMARSSEF